MSDTPRTDKVTRRYESMCGNPGNCFDYVEPEEMAQLERENNLYSETLHDGYSVYSQLNESEKRFTSPENVSAVLDAFKRVLLLNKQAKQYHARHTEQT